IPSSEPLETTIATFSIVAGSTAAGRGSVSSSVIVRSFLDAALGLRDAADLGGELGRPLGKELVELLDRDAGFLAERADARRRPRGEVALAHEAHDEPVAIGQLGNAVLAGDSLGDLLVPLLGIGQEALGVYVDRGICDQGHGHLVLLSQAGTGIRFLPAVGIAGPMPGISRPGSSACQ